MSATTTARTTSRPLISQPAGFLLAIAASAILGLAVGTALDDVIVGGGSMGATNTGASVAEPASVQAGNGPAGMPQPAMRERVSGQPQLE